MNIRTSKPGAGNKFYITKSKGGYSTCIQGKPTDTNCNVLSNCVGYACGRFNEIIGSMKYPSLNCNAEKFIERAKSAGLEISDVPTLGGIMVWQKGATLNGSDGAGHVAIVERLDSKNQIYTSESAYGGSAFYNSTRTNNNGRWGIGSGYTFRGCIINPVIGKVVYVEQHKLSIEEIAKKIINEPNFGGYGTGETRFTKLKAEGYDPQAVQNKINELCGVQPKQTKTITKGSKVRMNSDTDYNGKKLSSWVKGSIFDVIQVDGNRIVIGKGNAVTAAVKKGDLTIL